MRDLGKKFVSGFGTVACALNFGLFVEPQKEPQKLEDLSKYHYVLTSGDLYQLHQNEKGSKVLSRYGISLNKTKDSVGLMVPLKDKYLVKVVDNEKAIEFNVSPSMGKKIIEVCESDINDIESNAKISLYGQAAQEVFKSLPAEVKSKLNLSPDDIVASLLLDDSPKLWYAQLPEEKRVSDLYQIDILARSKNWEIKRLAEKTGKVKPSSDLLRHIDLTDEEHNDLLLKFIEGKKYESGGDFFISEGESVIVHDSLASIIALNGGFIEGVYNFLPGEMKENLPKASEVEYIFIHPSKEGISLDIGARESYYVDLKNQAKKDLLNFLSKYGYTNPLKFKH